jgi:hypothetical protein
MPQLSNLKYSCSYRNASIYWGFSTHPSMEKSGAEYGWRRERNWDRTFSRRSIAGHGVGRVGRDPKGAPSPPPEAAKRPFCPGVALGSQDPGWL